MNKRILFVLLPLQAFAMESPVQNVTINELTAIQSMSGGDTTVSAPPALSAPLQTITAISGRKMIFSAAIATYIATYGYTFYLEYLIHHHYWGQWKKDLPLTALTALPASEIIKELTRTFDSGNEIKDLLHILQEMAHEHDRLHTYMNIQKCFIFSLLPYQRQFNQVVYQQLIRLDFIKKTILQSLCIRS